MCTNRIKISLEILAAEDAALRNLNQDTLAAAQRNLNVIGAAPTPNIVANNIFDLIQNMNHGMYLQR